MNRKILFFTFITVSIILISCKSDKGPEIGNVQLANPATTNCIKNGGELVIVNGRGGEYGVCLFKDNSVCEEWAFYKGKCKIGECKKECKFINSENEGWYDCKDNLIVLKKCSVKK